MSNKGPFPPQGLQGPSPQSTSEKKPITKRWWFWVLAVIVVIFLLSRCGGEGGEQIAATTPSPQSTTATGTTPAPAPAETTAPVETAPAPTREQRLEAAVARTFGGETFDDVCVNGRAAWMCNVESIKVVGNSVQVNVTRVPANYADADDLARVWHTGISQSDDTGISDLLRVDVISNAGESGHYTRPF